MATSFMAASWMPISDPKYKLNSLGKTGCLSNFLGLFFHATGTSSWLLRPIMVSISSGLYPGYFQLSNCLKCSGIQFSNPPVTQQMRPQMTTNSSLYSTSVNYRMPCQWSPDVSHPIFI